MSDYIPEDSYPLILKHLPVKTLLRFRCVCKRWKEIIDSPVFIREHLAIQKPRFLIQDDSSIDYYVFDPHLPLVHASHWLINPIGNDGCLFLGTHHGVICLYDFEYPDDILLWNPSILKLSWIPLLDSIEAGWESIEMGDSCFGFWIDASTKEFKLIILNVNFDAVDDEDPADLQGILYSSILQDWRGISVGEVENWGALHKGPPVMIDGVAHWRGYKHEQKAHMILSFDFELEKFDFIEMPDMSSSIHPVHFRWEGVLALLCKKAKSLHKWDMYLRKEGSWVKMVTFKVISPLTNIFWVLGEGKRVRLLADFDLRLVLYDIRGAYVIPLKEEYADVYVSYDFVESLLFP